MRLEALPKERQVHRLFIQELSTDHHNQPEYVRSHCFTSRICAYQPLQAYDVPTQSRASSSDSQPWVLLIKEQVARTKDHEEWARTVAMAGDTRTERMYVCIGGSAQKREKLLR